MFAQNIYCGVMNLQYKTVACLLAGIALSGCVSTNGVEQETYTANTVAGKTKRLYRATSVNLDCTPLEAPTFTVIQHPLNGKVFIRKDGIVPSYYTGKYRKCNGRRIPGTASFYTATPGFVGSDTVKLRIAFDTGEMSEVSIRINVK
uniref:Uncharacterized protein n=1 Tax=Ochrobactrum sp. LM19 TaxID=1449781 RepID=A0A0D5A095_9HYPH|nr:hypothetical protein pLM19O2_p17 [Ochrobactrum sp. LM19]